MISEMLRSPSLSSELLGGQRGHQRQRQRSSGKIEWNQARPRHQSQRRRTFEDEEIEDDDDNVHSLDYSDRRGDEYDDDDDPSMIFRPQRRSTRTRGPLRAVAANKRPEARHGRRRRAEYDDDDALFSPRHQRGYQRRKIGDDEWTE
jgi:hypothetical protein